MLNFILSLGFVLAEVPADYQSLSARNKAQILWYQIENTAYSEGNYPPPKFSFFDVGKLLSSKYLDKTFSTVSDEFPYTLTDEGKKEYRKRIIHSKGTVAMVNFRPISGHRYTGIFKHGGIGLVRISTAMPGSFLPGMALKMFVNARPSENLVAMKSLTETSENCDPFFANFRTMLPEISGPLKFAAFAFAKVAEDRGGIPTKVSVKGLAKTNSDPNSEAPDFLEFRPSEAAKSLEFNCDSDYRMSLESLHIDDKLYDVYAGEKDQLTLVGELVIALPFVASEYGDEVLFFQHSFD